MDFIGKLFPNVIAKIPEFITSFNSKVLGSKF